MVAVGRQGIFFGLSQPAQQGINFLFHFNHPQFAPHGETLEALEFVHLLQQGGIGLLAGAALAGLIWAWLKRPKRLPPPPPPRPPWELALEELARLKSFELLRAQRYADFYAQVSDTVRKYLGGRFGYDGLECTTREAIAELRRQAISQSMFHSVDQFLTQADLVKFARLTPTEPECMTAIAEAETIVTATLPVPEVRQDENTDREKGAPA